MKNREYTLDLLRVIATFGIIFHHYQQITGVVFEGGLNFWGGKFDFGSFVEFFFILSGYFMYPYIERIKDGLSFKEFWGRRWLRLMPLLIIAALTYEAIIWIYVNYSNAPQTFFGIHQISATGLIIALMGMQDGWGFLNYMINNPMWYVSVLLLCYLIFFIIVKISRANHIPLEYMCVALSLLGSGAISYQISLPFLNLSSERGYMAFFYGVALAIFIEKHRNKITEVVALIVVVVTIAWLMLLPNNIGNSLFLYTYAFYPSVIICAKNESIRMIFNKRLFGLLGRVSYDTFVWHLSMLAIINIVVYINNREELLSNPMFMVAFSILCWIFGGLSYSFIDLPIQNAVKSKC